MVCLIYKAVKYFSKVVVWFRFSPTVYEVSIVPHTHQHLVFVSLFPFSIAIPVTVSHCGFNLHLPWWLITLSIFSCAIYNSDTPLVKCQCKSPANFRNWVVFLLLSSKSSLHTLNTTPLSVICFANIFSHSVTFILLKHSGNFPFP